MVFKWRYFFFWQKDVFSSYSIFLLETLDFPTSKNSQTTGTRICQSDKRLKQFWWVSWLMLFTCLHPLVLLHVLVSHTVCPMIPVCLVTKTVSCAFFPLLDNSLEHRPLARRVNSPGEVFQVPQEPATLSVRIFRFLLLCWKCELSGENDGVFYFDLNFLACSCHYLTPFCRWEADCSLEFCMLSLFHFFF